MLIRRLRRLAPSPAIPGRWLRAGLQRPLRIALTLALVIGLIPTIWPTNTTDAASVTSATFSGGILVPNAPPATGSTRYAKSGTALTLTVVTSSDTRCVTISGGYSATQTSPSPKTNWSFAFTGGTGNGLVSVTASAWNNFNTNKGECNGSSTTTAGDGFILDNAGPTVTGTLAPLANAAGWNKSDVTITWAASDAGSGIATGPTPTSDSVTANTAGVTKTASATDRLGNAGNGSVTVKLDKTAPTIGASLSPPANPAGWNNSDVTVSFTCADGLSGIKSCTSSTTVTSQGAGQLVPGTAVDIADNSADTSATVNIDRTPPTLSGAPTASPNIAGWYSGDVTIAWTCSDSLSGLAGACPANSTIIGEGTGLTASASVSDQAGNATNAVSSPAVKIDRTPPSTSANAPTSWNNTSVNVSLTPSDSLSGVKATYYTIDGGAPQTGTNLTISADGNHALTFWSEDNAGNSESPHTVNVKIDKTPPTINHTQSPPANVDGWNKTSVTVTFTCGDTGGSGIASCTSPQTITGEGQNQPVTGTAVDNAGNSATDPATVSIDLTAPSISAAPDRPANANSWYRADVTVSFTCGDALSGIKSCPAPATLGEGASQSVSGTASDAAGNTANGGVSGINIDKTAPTISGSASGPLTNGWYTGDVTVQWTCADALSTIDGSCPVASLITGEGDSLSASASISDKAGNSATGSVTGIKIDRTAPSTLVSLPVPVFDGWHANAILITLNASDALAGVATTYYRIDGGAPQTYAGPFSHSTSGIHTLTFWSVDVAGNIEDQSQPGHTAELKIDTAAPTISGSSAPAATTYGWNNTDVLVSFHCEDADSGLASCSDPIPVVTEGQGQSVIGSATDNVGREASTTVTVNIDKTAPTLTGAASALPNAAHWYKGNVTIVWTGQDALSGIDPASQPANSVITGEGSNLGAGPAFILDKAGNQGSGTVSGIKIDRTKPTITGQTVNNDGTPRLPNAAGWFNSGVRVRFTCSDALSGVQECASDVVLETDGASLSANGTATDMADNSATTSVTGIKIDSQAPQTVADNICTGQNGWCRGSTATVNLTATDQAGLSGVKEIRYRVNNNNSWLIAAGASTNVIVPLAAKNGVATVEYFAVDNAGNSEPISGVSLKYDNIAPAVTHTVSPAPTADGWNKTSVLVHFNATDDDSGTGGSGVDLATVTADQTLTAETTTAGQVVNGQAYDKAGNLGTDTVTVKIDKTLPTISGSATGSLTNGWYTGPVTVHFTCADALSGVASCQADVTLTTNGSNQSVTGTVSDRANNTASTVVGGLNIDSNGPTITGTGVVNNGLYTLGSVPTPTCTATDDLSGVVSCTIAVSGGLANGVGTFTFIATATDAAGHVATASGTYKVIYRWDGYVQPINDTAHQIDQDVSIFKGGSTVPAKFQLKNAAGAVLQANSLPAWLTPVKGGLTTAAIDESVYSDSTTSGNSYRWDATAQQYIYNWGTRGSTAGYYYRIGVKLDDGQTYYVTIGLR